jgi:hypothetical protein
MMDSRPTLGWQALRSLTSWIRGNRKVAFAIASKVEELKHVREHVVTFADRHLQDGTSLIAKTTTNDLIEEMTRLAGFLSFIRTIKADSF